MTNDRDVGWVRELVRSKRRGPHAQPAARTGEDLSPAFSTLRAEVWQEVIARCGRLQRAVGHEEISVALQAGGWMSLSKHAFPAGYLDIVPDRPALRFLVAVKLRKDDTAPMVEHVFEGGCVTRDGTPRPVWFGSELPVPEIVRRILTPFFGEI